MPSEDVSDLRDVVDAINKLCDTMKTSYEEYEDCCDVQDVDTELIEPTQVVIHKVETYVAEHWTDAIEVESSVAISEEVVEETGNRLDVIDESQMIQSEPIEVKEIQFNPTDDVKVYQTDQIEEIKTTRNDQSTEVKTTRSDTIDETETVVSDCDLVTAEPTQYEPTSEMYFTASSEVSLSDVDMQERLCLSDDSDKKRDDRNSVMAGHVAAMREHFESMTRTNTPCPELLRSSSPSFEIFRTVTNSPDN